MKEINNIEGESFKCHVVKRNLVGQPVASRQPRNANAAPSVGRIRMAPVAKAGTQSVFKTFREADLSEVSIQSTFEI